ncbi:hypothetical protein J4573_03935 [Actinomadura barringtoniae]|uniref:Uncharacterized protein n=1 Tax=Actinomadura barringtoniae TaxID=1427535 RepID=A0A939T0U7_9ACTN|nr:hypothetical protein [Actinomadura barringtoniae]MBO2446226.1 hypothetical protein [Actinomadura barringtoniae]
MTSGASGWTRPPPPPGGRPRAVAALLLWPVFLLLIGAAAVMIFVGVQDLYEAGRPVTCGGKAMPEDSPYMCLTGNGPRTRDDLERERDEQTEQAPYMLAFGVVAAVVGVPGIRRATRHLGRVQDSMRVT